MQHNFKRKAMSVLAAVTAAVCFVIPASSAADDVQSEQESNVTGTVEIKPSVYEEYLTWSQMDPRWSETPMGTYNIRSAGCLLTSLAIMAVHSDSLDETALGILGINSIEEFNPAVLANAYTNVGGFTSGGAIASWGTISTLVPQIQFGGDTYLSDTSKEGAAAELRALMDEGWHIIARVNNGYFHWVYIRAISEDGDIVMSDPAMEEMSLYEAYPNGLQGEYWMVKGKNAPADCDNTLAFKAELNIDVSAPSKTEYDFGEELDLAGVTVAVNGVDPMFGPWSDGTAEITGEQTGFSVDLGGFDPEKPGTYTITVTVEKSYAKGTASFEVTVGDADVDDGCEYFLKEGNNLPIYGVSDGKVVVGALNKGEVITVEAHFGKYGLIRSENFVGWVDVLMLEKTDGTARQLGDINNDGSVNKYDLALLNAYLHQDSLLPDGISTLSSAELRAADVNKDGSVDLLDVIEYLKLINM